MKRSLLYIIMTVIVSLVVTNSGPGVASADSIKELEDEMNRAEKEQLELDVERNNITNEKEETKGKINDNLSEQDIINNEIKSIDDKVSSTKNKLSEKEEEINTVTEEISGLETSIEDLGEDIIVLNVDIKDLRIKIEKREVLLENRLRSIQKTGGEKNYLEVILGSTSFADFVSRSLTVTTIMDQDKSIMEEHARDQSALETKVTQVAEKKETVEEQKEEVETNKVVLEKQKVELVKLDEQLTDQLSEKKTLIANLESEYGDLEEFNISLEDEELILASQSDALQKAKEIAQSQKSDLEHLAKVEAEEERKAKAEVERKRIAQAEAQATKEKAQATAQKEKKEPSSKPAVSTKNNETSSKPTEKVESTPVPKPNPKPESKPDLKPESKPNPKPESKPNPKPESKPTPSSSIFAKPTNGTLTSSFGERIHPITGKRSFHSGTDIGAPSGTPVNSTANGVVIRAGWMNGYGNTILVAHNLNGQSYTTLYGHLSSISVSNGQVINQNQMIGKVGSTGQSTGPHLHFEIHQGGYRTPGSTLLNPLNYIQ